MAANGIHTAVTHKYDPHFTDNVINAIGPKASPRVRKVFPGLIRHLHDFCREEEITISELMAAIDFINEAGRWSTDTRNEGQLVADILGVESLVDEITYKVASEAKDLPTATAVLGPFWMKDAPHRKMGDSVIEKDMSNGDRTWMHGKVLDFKTGEPVDRAVLDVWHTAPNGLYSQQDPDQPHYNLRGRFTTGPDGSYDFYCLRPTKYPIPYDGPGGQLVRLLDRHPYRPAHIHFIVSAPGYKPLVTQIFDRKSEYLDNDSVFAVKDSLIVDFQPLDGNPKAEFHVPYDIKLVSYEA